MAATFTRTRDSDGSITVTDGDVAITYVPGVRCVVDLGTHAPRGSAEQARVFDPSHGVYELGLAAATWDGDAQALAQQALINTVYLLAEEERLRRVVASMRRERDQVLDSYQARVRNEVLAAYADHRSHVTRDALNEFLRSLDLEPEPVRWVVTVRETAQREGRVTVEAATGDDAQAEAYRAWENGSSAIDWDGWDAQESDLDEYEVEESDD